jgi:hypothetical protein
VIWPLLAFPAVLAFLAFEVRRAFRNGGMDVIGGRVSPLIVLVSASGIAVAWAIAVAVQLGLLGDNHYP